MIASSMFRQAAVWFVVPLLVTALADNAAAQAAGQRAVDRYNRVAKGSNISEWHRRLFDPKPNVRLEAVESLGKDGSKDAVKPLLDATSDSDPRVRAKAIDYLGAIGSPMATPVLTQYLVLNNTDKPSQQRVLVALGRIADPAAVDPLLAFIQKSQDSELRCSALYALGEIGDQRALDAVQAFKDSSDPNMKRIATDAETKIHAKLAAIPNNQPTILELERRLRPPEPQQEQQ